MIVCVNMNICKQNLELGIDIHPFNLSTHGSWGGRDRRIIKVKTSLSYIAGYKASQGYIADLCLKPASLHQDTSGSFTLDRKCWLPLSTCPLPVFLETLADPYEKEGSFCSCLCYFLRASTSLLANGSDNKSTYLLMWTGLEPCVRLLSAYKW